jgi:hypothetical protein
MKVLLVSILGFWLALAIYDLNKASITGIELLIDGFFIGMTAIQLLYSKSENSSQRSK